jgi:hypothetical protein
MDFLVGVSFRRLTKLLEDYFGEKSSQSAQGNPIFRKQRDIYERCKQAGERGSKTTNKGAPLGRIHSTTNGGWCGRRRKFNLTLEEMIKFTPDIIVGSEKTTHSEGGRKGEEEEGEEYEGDEAGDEKEHNDARCQRSGDHITTFLLHATNGNDCGGKKIRREGIQTCNMRQFDFVEVMYATTDKKGRTTFASEIARIMGIIRLTTGKRLSTRTTKSVGGRSDMGTKPHHGCVESKHSFLVLIAWMKDDDEKRIQQLRKANPLRYMKYNFDYYESQNGRRVPRLWLDLVTLQQILQPVCAYHDPDLAPTYDSESHIMEKARFNVITLTQTKKCYRMFRPIIGEGDPLSKAISHIEGQPTGGPGTGVNDEVAMEWNADEALDEPFLEKEDCDNEDVDEE